MESCGSFFEDMYSIPSLDIDARNVAASLLQELVEYAAAIQPACTTKLRSRSVDTNPPPHHELLIETPCSSKLNDDDVMDSLTITVADMLSSEKNRLFASHGSETDRESRTTAGCYSDISEHNGLQSLHIDSIVRFFKVRRAKLWPLTTFQTHLRSVFFGDKYWQRVTTSRCKPSVAALDQSIFTLTAALHDLYLPKRKVQQPGTELAVRPTTTPASVARVLRRGTPVDSAPLRRTFSALLSRIISPGN